MPNAPKESEAHHQIHDTLHNTVGSHHEKLAQIHADIARLEQQKAVVKAVAAAELSKSALGLSAEAVARVTASCW